jgi:hypothetical protein
MATRPVPAKPNALRLVQHGAGEPAAAMADPMVAIAGAVHTAPPTMAPFLRNARLLWLDMLHPFSILGLETLDAKGRQT